MPIAVETASGTLTLQELEGVIRDAEAIMGRLCTFGAGETDETPINLMSFEDRGAPARAVSLQEIPEGGEARKEGHVLACLARTFVSGELRLVAAFRPAA